MNAGKSTSLLQSAFNYNERGMDTILLTPSIDTRYGVGKISSRIGLERPAIAFDRDENLFFLVQRLTAEQGVSCILVDEAQFMTKAQVEQLCRIVDECRIPVLTYGIRTDFVGEPFEGSKYLLAWADKNVELKTVCHCGKKASMNLRLSDGQVVREGETVMIGGNESYVATCRRHFFEGIPYGQKEAAHNPALESKPFRSDSGTFEPVPDLADA